MCTQPYLWWPNALNCRTKFATSKRFHSTNPQSTLYILELHLPVRSKATYPIIISAEWRNFPIMGTTSVFLSTEEACKRVQAYRPSCVSRSDTIWMLSTGIPDILPITALSLLDISVKSHDFLHAHHEGIAPRLEPFTKAVRALAKSTSRQTSQQQNMKPAPRFEHWLHFPFRSSLKLGESPLSLPLCLRR